MKACPHGRSVEWCVRCDPWCPRGYSEETYERMQGHADMIVAMRGAVCALSDARCTTSGKK